MDATHPLLIERVPGKTYIAIFLFGIYPFLAFWLFSGGFWGLPGVETRLWGGLFLTILLGSVGIVFSLPIGVILALGRRSDLPVIRLLSTTFITRSGQRDAMYIAVMPPIESPHRCVRATPHASSTASASRARSSMDASAFDPTPDFY